MVLDNLSAVRDVPRLAHVVSVFFGLCFVPDPKMFVEVGEGVAKCPVWVGNDGWIVSAPVIVGKNEEETLGECLVYMHALDIVLLVGLPFLTDEGISYSGFAIVVRWRVPWIFQGRWVEVWSITGVVLPHVLWDYKEDPVEVTVVGDM